MKKWVFFGIFLVFLAGCATDGKKEPQSYHIGTQGLELNFMYGNPPPKIYKGEELSIIIELKNKGAYPNPEENRGAFLDGKIYLHGYDTAYIDSFFPKQLPADLYGKDEFNSEGGYTTMTFQSSSVNMPDGADTIPQSVQASVCYRYQTTATPTVCIDPDPYSTKIKNKPCSINQVQMTSSQGAPVAVTRVEQDVLQSKIAFKITVSNVGGGRIVESNNLNKCPGNLDYYNTDIVYVSGEISNGNIYCKNNGQLRLRNNVGTIICEANKPESDLSAYKTPLKIKLDYAYTKTIRTDVRIVNLRG